MNEKRAGFKSLEGPVLERERKICCFPVLLRRKQSLFSGQEFFGRKMIASDNPTAATLTRAKEIVPPGGSFLIGLKYGGKLQA